MAKPLGSILRMATWRDFSRRDGVFDVIDTRFHFRACVVIVGLIAARRQPAFDFVGSPNTILATLLSHVVYIAQALTSTNSPISTRPSRALRVGVRRTKLKATAVGEEQAGGERWQKPFL